MSKNVGLLLVLVFLTASLLVPPLSVKASSTTIVVPDDYLNIQDAINAANEDDTILVKKGYYVENPVINKTVSLVGEDRDTTVIDVTAGLKVERDCVTVAGLTVFDGYEGISVMGANCCNIYGNKVVDAQIGIALNGGENNSVSGNLLTSIGYGAAIVLWYSDHNLIKSNKIDLCTEGIQLRLGSSYNVVKENIITNCEFVAVRLLGGYSPPRWYYPKGNTIMRNNISNSNCGTTIYASNNNVISKNNYVNNTYQFSANEEYFLTWGGNVSVNNIERNYWSDYSGTDANGDGIGDVPHVLDENNVDPQPLMKPVAIPVFLEPTPTPELTPTPEPTTSSSYNQPQSLQNQLILGAAATLTVIGVGVGLLVYFKKRKH